MVSYRWDGRAVESDKATWPRGSLTVALNFSGTSGPVDVPAKLVSLLRKTDCVEGHRTADEKDVPALPSRG